MKLFATLVQITPMSVDMVKLASAEAFPNVGFDGEKVNIVERSDKFMNGINFMIYMASKDDTVLLRTWTAYVQ